MITLIVTVDCKPEYFDNFITETTKAKYLSLEEIGCVGYTINKDNDNENGVILIEQYLSEEAIEEHRNSIHFRIWRENVQDCMNTPRKAVKLIEI